MTQHSNFTLQRSLLRALLASSTTKRKDLLWEFLSIDESSARQALHLLGLTQNDEYIQHLSHNVQICQQRTDPLTLRIKGFEKQFSRKTIAEAIGAMGSQFFPTRQKAYRSAFEAAREAAYFGYGELETQCLPDPLAKLSPEHTPQSKPAATILRDLREDFQTDRSILDMLQKDRFFLPDAENTNDYRSFQTTLRNMPLDGAMVEKLSAFFNKRATIGLRDGMRWFLGSRHPWFSWERARELIMQAFKAHGKENFNTPQIIYYSWDPTISEEEIQTRRAFNDRVARAFAADLAKSVESIPELAALDMHNIALWILDIHHDYPDFDLESEGFLGAKAHLSFLSHSIQGKVNQNLLGEDAKMRRNFKIEAHFKANDLITRFLHHITPENRIAFFCAANQELQNYHERGGAILEEGICEFDRIPCTLLVFQDCGQPKLQNNERLLDSFNLSEITQLEHASYIRAYSEISEKLVIFFTLALRHMLDTQHVPDLHPKDILKDFLLLGLWGTRTEKIRIHLYVAQDSNAQTTLTDKLARSEVRFVGMDQIETYELSQARAEGKLARFAVSQISPLIEPSILRVLGTFTMAMEEFRTGNHAQNLDAFSLTRYGIDITREALRYGVKVSLTDAASLIEFGLDATLDSVQTGIDRLQQKLSAWKSKKDR